MSLVLSRHLDFSLVPGSDEEMLTVNLKVPESA